MIPDVQEVGVRDRGKIPTHAHSPKKLKTKQQHLLFVFTHLSMVRWLPAGGV